MIASVNFPTPPATEAAQRASVVAEARKWLGTPYHPSADVPGAGVDCGMLIVRAFVDAGLVAPFDPRPYPQDWHLHRSDEKYLGFVGDLCKRVDAPQPGDVAVFRYGRCYSHGAIVTHGEPLVILHAYMPARRVIEEPLKHNSVLCEPDRKMIFFSLWADASSVAAAPHPAV